MQPGSDTLLERWTHVARTAECHTVYPDGCCDLILGQLPGQPPVWRLTTLFDRAMPVSAMPGERLVGYRLRAGTSLDVHRLMALTAGRHDEQIDVPALLAELVLGDSAATHEALHSLAARPSSVAGAARSAGIGPRTFERLLARTTGRSPLYWLSLARARQAARRLGTGEPLIEIAAGAGYADQSHMSREFNRWFGQPPGRLRRDRAALASLAAPGFG